MSHRQWYAMRNKLQKEGRWNPKHKVPPLEEGEPPSKQSRIENPEGDGADRSDPEEGTSKNARGKLIITFLFQIHVDFWICKWIQYSGMGQ